MANHIVLFDWSFVVKRIYYSRLGNRDPFTSILLALYDCEKTRRLIDPTAEAAFAFDRKPYLRSEAFPGYKVKPKKDEDENIEELFAQINSARTKYLEAVGFANVFSKPGYEADDVIATIVNSVGTTRVTIVSRDKDLYQLLSKRVSIYDPVDRRSYSNGQFKEDYGIHPTQWSQVKALAGCTSDCVPGQEKVGEITALKHLTGEKPSKRCEDWIASGGYAKSLELVTLPYRSWKPEWAWQRPKPFDIDAWVQLCSALDREALAEAVLGVRSR